MKFTLSWLKDFLETNASLEEICQKLNSIGHEVEEIIDKSALLEPFKVAYIKDAWPHKDANKLKICIVDTGKEELQIICGGLNARKGIKVALASIGTTIPTNNLKIKKASIRGVESNGMLCSMEELGLGTGKEGEIIELTEEAIIGDNIAKYLAADDPIIEIAITPNRGDCLGVYGIARDLAAADLGTLKPITTQLIKGLFPSPITIEIRDQETCPQYFGRYLKNVSNKNAPTWIVKRLQAIGCNSISGLVDLSNYIMFTYGRPLHVYDADKINNNKLSVRKATSNDIVKALDNKDYQCKGFETILSDENQAKGFAGIIGDRFSAVDHNTKNIFIEIAYFEHDSIAKTGRNHQIDTDSRYRMERQLDYEFLEQAMDITSEMFIDLFGGQPSEVIKHQYKEYQTKNINFNEEFIFKISGIRIFSETITNILNKLGFKVKISNSNYNVIVPSWRNDISIKEDIAEEILRIYGYDKITSITLPKTDFRQKIILDKKQIFSKRARRLLASRSYYEVITWSFMDKDKAILFKDINKDLMILNPISSDLNYMRPTILANLLEVYNKNKVRGNKDLSVFEIGPVFFDSDANSQHLILSAIRTGNISPTNHCTSKREIDLFDIKNDLSELFDELGFNFDNLIIDDNNLPKFLHPGKSANLKIGKKIIGYFGEIHPLITKYFKIKTKIYCFEIFLESIPEPRIKKGRKPQANYSDYQEVNRDFAFIVDKEQKSSEIVKTIKQVEREIIKDIVIFDVYIGENLDHNQKSIALSVTMQHPHKTLTDNEIEDISSKIIFNIEKEFAAKLRN